MLVPKRITDELLYTTVRIETNLSDGSTGVGTGFFFIYSRPDYNTNIYLIITNKHVVQDAILGRFRLHKAIERNGRPEPTGTFIDIEIDDLEKNCFYHPDANVDLCAIPAIKIFNTLEKRHIYAFFSYFKATQIPDNSELSNLAAVEDVLMIGYPNGIWDEVNNFPLIRRGITATHPSVDFCGKPITCVDITVIPGSSGSPVLIINEGAFHDGQKFKVGGHRIMLLGVLFAGPIMTTEGEIFIREIPVKKVPLAQIELLIHLGYIVKAREINRIGEEMIKVMIARGELPHANIEP